MNIDLFQQIQNYFGLVLQRFDRYARQNTKILKLNMRFCLVFRSSNKTWYSQP